MSYRTITGAFKGTGSDIYLVLGGVPERFECEIDGGGTPYSFEWNRQPLSKAAVEGYEKDGDGTITAKAFGEGAQPWNGRYYATTTNSSYLVQNQYDSDEIADGASGAITAWTLDTAASRTGSFDNPINTGTVVVGSRVAISQNADGETKEAYIVAITNDGDAADEIELDREVGSGVVLSLHRPDTFVPIIAGRVAAGGLKIDSTLNVNQSGVLVRFRATMEE